MCCVVDPLHSVLVIFQKDRVHQVQKVEVLQGVELMGVDVNIGESPFHIRDKGDDKTIRLCGGSHGKPCASSVHDGELPVLLSVFFWNGGANHGLSFVKREKIANDGL